MELLLYPWLSVMDRRDRLLAERIERGPLRQLGSKKPASSITSWLGATCHFLGKVLKEKALLWLLVQRHAKCVANVVRTCVESALFFPGVVQPDHQRTIKDGSAPGGTGIQRHWNLPTVFQLDPLLSHWTSLCFLTSQCLPVFSHTQVSSRFSAVSRVPASSVGLFPMLIYLVFMNRGASFIPYFYKQCPHRR